MKNEFEGEADALCGAIIGRKCCDLLSLGPKDVRVKLVVLGAGRKRKRDRSFLVERTRRKPFHEV